MNSKARKCTPTPIASRATVGDVPLHSPLNTRAWVSVDARSYCDTQEPSCCTLYLTPCSFTSTRKAPAVLLEMPLAASACSLVRITSSGWTQTLTTAPEKEPAHAHTCLSVASCTLNKLMGAFCFIQYKACGDGCPQVYPSHLIKLTPTYFALY